MNWDLFPTLVLIIATLWIVAIPLFLIKKTLPKTVAAASMGAGIAVLAFFIVDLWLKLDRPPMRTLGETRLWYSFFLSFIGFITYLRWKHAWVPVYTIALSLVFLAINYFRPETHEKELMPALQSVWFVPHVIVYMISYALLAVASLVAARDLLIIVFRRKPADSLRLADNFVYLGFAFLTMGLLFGALWAKEAWGHYWTFDPKETWALITWLMYLIYMHIRYNRPKQIRWGQWFLAFAFLILLICWFGVNYLAVAQNSVHTYSG
ncbi:MAG: cytochrome c biogenesis protein CcsA [Bacteroidetes bacterium]|nr:cytochrome c biogenesis protein CcsA [Bacteroidota bacterium]MBU1720067.1 cytochrome c biogenesis protein CcsA [Bacteroidota bacterium]